MYVYNYKCFLHRGVAALGRHDCPTPSPDADNNTNRNNIEHAIITTLYIMAVIILITILTY